MANPVVEGFLKGKSLGVKGTAITVDMMPSAHAVVGYDVVSDGRNVALGVKSAAIAGVLTGGVGLVGGALALKKKRLAVITWRGGQESLVEVRSAKLHSALVAASFCNR